MPRPSQPRSRNIRCGRKISINIDIINSITRDVKRWRNGSRAI
jgi:hypothetical protein